MLKNCNKQATGGLAVSGLHYSERIVSYNLTFECSTTAKKFSIKLKT